MQQPTPDLTELEIAAGLANFAGDRKTYGDLLQQFAAQHAGDVAAIRQLLRDGNRPAAAQRMHTLAGISSFLRASSVAALAEACEQALVHDAKEEALHDLLVALETAISRVQDAIARFTHSSATPES